MQSQFFPMYEERLCYQIVKSPSSGQLSRLFRPKAIKFTAFERLGPGSMQRKITRLLTQGYDISAKQRRPSCSLAKVMNGVGGGGDYKRIRNTQAAHIHRVLMDMAKLEEFCKDNVGNCTFLVCCQTSIALLLRTKADLLFSCDRRGSNSGGVSSQQARN